MILKYLATIPLVIALTGCISITKELPAFQTYSLKIDNEKFSDVKIDKSIYVLEPKSLISTNSNSIVYTKDDLVKENYALSKWSDKPSKMIQNLIVSKLTTTNSYKYITSSNIKQKSDFKLISELDNFSHEINSNNQSFALFSIRVYLVDSSRGKIYFKNFSYKKESNSHLAKDAVLTLNSLVNTFLIDLDTFIKESISNN